MDELVKIMTGGKVSPESSFGMPGQGKPQGGGASPADQILKQIQLPMGPSPMVPGAKPPQVDINQLLALFKGGGKLGA